MTATPDTETDRTEQEQAMLDHIDEFLSDECVDNDAAIRLFEDLEPLIAAIRRQAAADALKTQADRLGRKGKFFRDQQRSLQRKGDAASAEVYDHYAEGYYRAARDTRQQAQDVIAEGYEHVCAAQTWATRDDPGHGCETPVESEGDYCDRHEPEDDEDPGWAE